MNLRENGNVNYVKGDLPAPASELLRKALQSCTQAGLAGTVEGRLWMSDMDASSTENYGSDILICIAANWMPLFMFGIHLALVCQMLGKPQKGL